MKLDTSALVKKSIHLGLREPRLWAFGTAMMAMAFAPAMLFRNTSMADPLHPVQLVVSLLGQLARTALLIGLSRQCLAIVRGERPIARDTFTTVGKNWSSIVLFGLAMCAIDRYMNAAMRDMLLEMKQGHMRASIFTIALPASFVMMTLYMMLPVLARETVGPVGALRRTAQILAQVWWPRFRGLLAIGFRFMLPFMLLMMLGGGLIVAWTVMWPGSDLTPFFVLFPLLMTLCFSLVITCDQLFDAGVYLAVTESGSIAAFTAASSSR